MASSVMETTHTHLVFEKMAKILLKHVLLNHDNLQHLYVHEHRNIKEEFNSYLCHHYKSSSGNTDKLPVQICTLSASIVHASITQLLDRPLSQRLVAKSSFPL